MATAAFQDGNGQDKAKHLECPSRCPVEQELVPECEVIAEGDEGSLETLYNDCEKHPGHPKFIRVKEFTSEHLPKELRTQETMDLIRMRCDRTVRVKVAYTSESRPDTFADGKTPYPYADCKGLRKIRYGTGTIIDFWHNKPIRDGPCPCPECQKSGQPILDYCLVKVVTASHVIFDDSEAEKAEFDCYYDTDDGEGVIKLYGFESHDVLLSSNTKWKCDMIGVKCVSHDWEYFEWLMLTQLNPSAPPRYMNITQPPSQVIVSHPHGCSKRITVGTIRHVTVPIEPQYETIKPYRLMDGTRCRLPIAPGKTMPPGNNGHGVSTSDTKRASTDDRPILLYSPSVLNAGHITEDMMMLNMMRKLFARDIQRENHAEPVEHVEPSDSGKKTIQDGKPWTGLSPLHSDFFDLVIDALFNSTILLGHKSLATLEERFTAFDFFFSEHRLAHGYIVQFFIDHEKHLRDFADSILRSPINDKGRPTKAPKFIIPSDDMICMTGSFKITKKNTPGPTFDPNVPLQPGKEYLTPPGMTFTFPEGAEYALRYSSKGEDRWFRFPPGTRFTSPDGTDILRLRDDTEFRNSEFSPKHCFVTYDIDTCPGSSGAAVYCDLLGLERLQFFPHCLGLQGAYSRSGIQINTVRSKISYLLASDIEEDPGSSGGGGRLWIADQTCHEDDDEEDDGDDDDEDDDDGDDDDEEYSMLVEQIRHDVRMRLGERSSN